MFEMACVSFNKVRLQYYVSQNKRRAKWLNFLLNRPSRLFGTTLIGVNTMLQLGSEFSRQLYESWHLSPDLAPLTQVLLVVIFGELAPMFAARRHPEQTAMLNVPIVYVISKILMPVILFIDGINLLLHKLLGKKAESQLFLSREELQKAFEERDTRIVGSEDVFATLTSRIFNLKNKSAKQAMIPLSLCQMIPSQSTLEEMRHILSVSYSPFIPIYHRFPQNIVAIAYPRDLLQVDEKKKVIDHSRPPWFITQDDSLLQILKQFRRNNQSVAVVLDPGGQAVGILSLDDLIDEVFGEADDELSMEEDLLPPPQHVEMTLPGTMLVSEFNLKFHASLEHEEEETISDLFLKLLNHHPAKGEVIHIEQFEFTVLEPSLFGAKTVSVRTIIK